MSYRSRLANKAPLVVAGCAVSALLTTPLTFAQEQAAPAATMQAQRVVVDAVTGQLRAPEAGEWTQPAAAQRSAARAGSARATSGLESHSAVQRLTAAPVSVRLGAVGKRVDMSKMAFSVARIGADGTLSSECVTGDAAATAALHSEVQGERNDK